MRTLTAAAALVAALCAFPALAEQAAIGSIKTLQGDATIIRGEARLPAALGTALRQDDVVATGADASVGITLRDETMLSIGPSTEIKLERFAFTPAEEEYSLVASITRGTLYYVSGLIAKLSPESASVVTPGGTIGVRGTRFAVRIRQD